MREHIDFLQVQWLDWADGADHGLPDMQVKILSKEDVGPDISLVVSTNAAFAGRIDAAGSDIEIYVLAGNGRINGLSYGPQDYAFFPAGIGPLCLESDSGITLFYCRSVSAATLQTDPARIAARAVNRISLREADWDGDFARFGLQSMASGARMKVLRLDPFDGTTTYITSTFAFRRGVQAERHPIAQEFYMLAGELAGPLGVMQAGAYCYRPPMALHGPYGSTTGALILFRSHGGEQATYWEDAAPFRYDPPLRPILPPRLSHLAMPWPATRNH